MMTRWAKVSKNKSLARCVVRNATMFYFGRKKWSTVCRGEKPGNHAPCGIFNLSGLVCI